jgi:hypothetical protein
VKLGAVALTVGLLRAVAGRLALEHVARVAARWAAPLAVAAFATATGWAAALDGARSEHMADLSGYVVVALGIALAAYLVASAARGRTRYTTLSVNPWL